MRVAIGQAFNIAMTGKSKHRPELAMSKIPLEARIAVLPCYGGESLLASVRGDCSALPSR